MLSVSMKAEKGNVIKILTEVSNVINNDIVCKRLGNIKIEMKYHSILNYKLVFNFAFLIFLSKANSIKRSNNSE